MIDEFRYGQTWKIWSSPLSLSLYNPFKYVELILFPFLQMTIALWRLKEI